MLFDTKEIPVNLRHYLIIYFDLMFQSPAFINNQKFTFEEISKLNTKDLIANEVSIGLGGYYDRLIKLRLQVIFI